MTKPVLTIRDTKGSPLTHLELDTNFENLRDATFTLTADTGGTQVVSDLNGVITLVAGLGVTLTGDNSAKTITITAPAVDDILGTNDIAVGTDDGNSTLIDSHTNTLNIRSFTNSSKFASLSLNQLGDIVFEAQDSTPGAQSTIQFNLDVIKIGSYTQDGFTYPGILQLGATAGTSDYTAQQGMIYLNTNSDTLQFYDGSNWNSVLTGSSGTVLDVGAYTTLERDAISPSPSSGAVIWNSDNDSLEVRSLGSWNTVIMDGTINPQINVESLGMGNTSNYANRQISAHGDLLVNVSDGDIYEGNLNLRATRIIMKNIMQVVKYTTAERDTYTPEKGDIIFNETTNKFQGYYGSGWVDFH